MLGENITSKKKKKKNKKRKSKTKLQNKEASSQKKHHGQKVPKKRPYSQSCSSPSRRQAANNESHRQSQEKNPRNPPGDTLYLSSDEEVNPKRQKRHVENEQEGKSMAGWSAGTSISSGGNPHYAPMSRWPQRKAAEPPLQVLHLWCYFQHRTV